MATLISIIMPVYNTDKYLKKAIQSCLNQTYQDFELILIDDNSSDNSIDIINEYYCKYPQKIKFFSFQDNYGPATARNKGIELANGKYIVFADSDDIQKPNRLEKIMNTFRNEEVEIICNNSILINEKGNSLRRDLGVPYNFDNKNALLVSLRRNYFYIGLSALKMGNDINFDESLKYSEDYDLFLRLIYKEKKFKFLKEPLTLYRIHQSNTSSNYQGNKEATRTILNKYSYKMLLNKMIKYDHDMKEIYNTLGIVALTKGEFSLADKYLNKAINSECDKIQDEIDTYFYLGVTNFKCDNLENAFLNFKKCYSLDDEEPTILNNLAVLTYIFGKDALLSKKLLEKALNIQPNYIDAKINLEKFELGDIPQKITEKFLRKSLVHTDNYKL